MIAQDIIRQAGIKNRSSSWYANALMNELLNFQKKDINEEDTGFIKPGDLVFFLYSAKYPQKYKFWDKQPLSYVIEVDMRRGLFLGSNLHYINPQYRGGIAQSYINKSGNINAPRKTLHNYLFSGVMSDLFKVPESDWRDVSLLPTERFVDKRGQPVFKSKVWDYPDDLSSP
jgi:hypothetical protein